MVGQPVVVARNAQARRELWMLLEAVLELAFEEGLQVGIRRGLRRADAKRAPCGERQQEKRAIHSTLPILCTTSASLCASLSQNARNCGWSRYCTGVSTWAIAALKVGSATTLRAASRSFAITGSGVPAGAKRPVHCENCAS